MAGIPIGATTGIPLGPLGVVAGGITGAITGPSVEMLYEVGSKAISDTFGIDEDIQEQIRDAMGNIITKREKRD